MTENNITTVTPFLTVNNCKKAVEFYVLAWGAIVVARYDIPDGKSTAKLTIESAEFWVGDEEPEFGNISPGLSGSPVRIILETKNADKLFEKALELGAAQICPMTTEEAWRIGKLKDPFGHIWEIGYIL